MVNGKAKKLSTQFGFIRNKLLGKNSAVTKISKVELSVCNIKITNELKCSVAKYGAKAFVIYIPNTTRDVLLPSKRAPSNNEGYLFK